jgi:hypothetical protein
MPGMTRKQSPVLRDRVVAVLKQGLKRAGFGVDAIETEPIKGTKLFRVTLIAKGFEKIWVTERQDLVWRILNRELTPDQQLRISMVLTLAPSEAVAV